MSINITNGIGSVGVSFGLMTGLVAPPDATMLAQQEMLHNMATTQESISATASSSPSLYTNSAGSPTLVPALTSSQNSFISPDSTVTLYTVMLEFQKMQTQANQEESQLQTKLISETQSLLGANNSSPTSSIGTSTGMPTSTGTSPTPLTSSPVRLDGNAPISSIVNTTGITNLVNTVSQVAQTTIRLNTSFFSVLPPNTNIRTAANVTGVIPAGMPTRVPRLSDLNMTTNTQGQVPAQSSQQAMENIISGLANQMVTTFSIMSESSSAPKPGLPMPQ